MALIYQRVQPLKQVLKPPHWIAFHVSLIDIIYVCIGRGPILCSDLIEAVTAEGFDNGGWFIFAKKDCFAYRTNEFSNKSYDECRKVYPTIDDHTNGVRIIAIGIMRH